jgi:hypothetical protein
MSLRTLRVVAVLLPAALLLHELAYAVAGGGLIGAHHYLQVLIPVAAAGGASLAFASLLLPALGRRPEAAQPFVPFVLAGVLLGVFAAQELAEATLMGGGAAGFAASLSVAWMAPPLALLLGLVGAGILVGLDRAGRLLAAPRSDRPSWPRGGGVEPAPLGPALSPLACRGLSFGFARRPPPSLHPS